MRIGSFRLAGIRCFEDTQRIPLSKQCNVFVGQNNAGKSTLLKGILALQQGFPFQADDIRPNTSQCFFQARIEEIQRGDHLTRDRPSNDDNLTLDVFRNFDGPEPQSVAQYRLRLPDDNGIFSGTWPRNFIVPFLAKRKAPGFDENITTNAQSTVSGTYHNLVSRIDLVATSGHPRHEEFKAAVQEIIGLQITTRSSQNGKKAGFYLDDDRFVTLDKMGDGVTEMVAIIVELCLARNKIFVLEEPETNLHPRGLKALLKLILEASQRNQFIIATHSNIVVRELGAEQTTKIFAVRRDDPLPGAASMVEPVEKTAVAHIELLRELGYEFVDLGLFEAWLFLEESSAERIINDVLVPRFVPRLRGKLRTFAAGGIANVEPGITEFQRLVTFVHLEPLYQSRLWIRVDGDSVGKSTVDHLVKKFPYLTGSRCGIFSSENFESYYPAEFQTQAIHVIGIADRPSKRKAKAQLLQDVLQWTEQNSAGLADDAWRSSANEIINVLLDIDNALH